LERLFLADEQPLIPRPWPVFADRSKHDGSSAIPPSASLYSEPKTIATKYILISPKRSFLNGRFAPQSGRPYANSIPGLIEEKRRFSMPDTKFKLASDFIPAIF
jgi:hypothetical protein